MASFFRVLTATVFSLLAGALLAGVFVYTLTYSITLTRAHAEERQAESPIPECSSCEKDASGNPITVVVNEHVTVDFNVNPPVCRGDTDLCQYFTYEKRGLTADTWQARFNLGGKKILITNGATVRTETVPITSNNRGAPGIHIETTCSMEIGVGSAIQVVSENQKAGDIFLKAGGDIRIDGDVLSRVGGTNGLPGSITIVSCCGRVLTGPESRIITEGNDHGGRNIDILAIGDIEIHGLVDASYKASSPPAISIFSQHGSILIDGTNLFGIEPGTQRPVTSGVFVRSNRDPLPGNIAILAEKNITVVGNSVLNSTHKNYGTIAIKTASNSSAGGIIDVRSLKGNIIATDRAFDTANRFNEHAAIRLLAGDAINLNVSSAIDNGATTSEKIIANAIGGKDGLDGFNIFSSCNGITISSGLVSPADIDTSDDVGLCPPAHPELWDVSFAPHSALKGKIETHPDLACFRGETPPPPPQNTKPVITVLGANPLAITEDETFTDPGATAHDTEDGNITSNVTVGGNTIDTHTPGTYTITYNVMDSGGLAADQKTRLVIVQKKEDTPPPLKQCEDNTDNDGDNKIDEEDPACHTDGDPQHTESYDPTRDNENERPVITLISDNPLHIDEGSGYLEPGATAHDPEDGNISDRIIIASNTVDANTPDTYTVTYNVSDSRGAAANEAERTVVVKRKDTTTASNNLSGVGSGSGGGGGGGSGGGSYIRLEIFNESVRIGSQGEAIISWDTNLQSTTKVAFSLAPHATTTYKMLGSTYGNETATNTALVSTHVVSLFDLSQHTRYYFRPGSSRSDDAVAGRELSVATATTSMAVTTHEPMVTVAPTTCTYLEGFIKLGAVNDPIEVRKLETFLRMFEGAEVPVDGVYDVADYEAVRAFQQNYFNDILAPWGHDAPTGYVYLTTRKKVNEIYCARAFPLTTSQLAEVTAFHALLTAARESSTEVNTESIGTAPTAPTFVKYQRSETATSGNTNDYTFGSLEDIVPAIPQTAAPKTQLARIWQAMSRSATSWSRWVQSLWR